MHHRDYEIIDFHTHTFPDKIADAAGGLSIPAYASIDGRVTYADDKKVVIESV